MPVENNRSEEKSIEGPEAKAERLRQDIAHTRSALSKDVRALGERLNPDQLKQDAKEVIHHAADAARQGARHMVRDARNVAVDSLREARDHAFGSISEGVDRAGLRARQVGHDVSDFVAAHALPLTVLGAGAGWLLLSLSHRRRLAAGLPYGADQAASVAALANVRERADALTSRASDALSSTGQRLLEHAAEVQTGVVQRVDELRAQVAERANDLGHQAAELSRHAYQGVEHAGARAVDVSERNPLAVGLVALAAGAAVAMLLPPTRRENQLLGRTRDQFVERAQRGADELKQSAQRTARDMREVVDEIREKNA